MSTPIVVWGTGPNSSKSHVCLALLRLLARDGTTAVPFKAVTVMEPDRWRHGGPCPIPHHVSAARTTWRPTMSPVVVQLADGPGPARGLLRIHGDPCGEVSLLSPDTLDGADLTRVQRADVAAAVTAALNELTGSGAAVVAEGAGSPVDAADDLANILVARHLAEARIVLSAYCWNGGTVAALLGTLECLPGDLRSRVIGFVQNRPMSTDAARRWADQISARTGLPLLAQVGDLSAVGSADLLQSADGLADPWADSFAAEADLSWLLRAHQVSS
ncbi:hypothetical protein [Catellatospora sichuanensis]|uniref:hypothetical protein n=1 Tax=Catellatospora sichuanensis TaxID=1969805 RepID=UPI0011821851|nr:hypothetical protein [Catellatospora sichuanensis]